MTAAKRADVVESKVDSMRSWALSRIRQCRVEEAQFAHLPAGQQKRQRAVAERTALEAVLTQLGLRCKHVGKPRCTVCGRVEDGEWEP